MGQSQSGASIPAGAGEVKNTACGENAGHRAAHSQETAGGRSGTPAETQKEQRFRHGHVIFLFSGTKVVSHAAFVKGRFTLRVKNTARAKRAQEIFYPSPLTNTQCFADRCLGKKKKMLFFGGFRFVILLPGFVRMVGVRTGQPGTQYHFVITVMKFYGVTLRYRFLFILVIVQ